MDELTKETRRLAKTVFKDGGQASKKVIRAVAKLPQKVDALADKATEAGTKRLEWARKQTEKALREVKGRPGHV